MDYYIGENDDLMHGIGMAIKDGCAVIGIAVCTTWFVLFTIACI